MKHFAVTREHLDYFYQHHFIEFEDLLQDDEIKNLRRGTLETLATRLHKDEKQLPHQTLKSLYMAGFDAWRENYDVKKIVLRPELAEIASELTKKKPLRIGYDQVFLSPNRPEGKLGDLPALFKHETTLAQTSCLLGVACGLILHLSAPAVPVETSKLSIQEDIEALIPLPRRAGSGIFFSPDIPLSLEHLFSIPNEHQLLIVFAQDKTLYRLCEEDPHTHVYKKQGYAFGDKLQNATHPIVYRG